MFLINLNAEIVACILSFRKLRQKPNLENTSKYGFSPDLGGKNGGVLSMRMQVILDSSFARPGSAPIWGGKKGEFRDWTNWSNVRRKYLFWAKSIKDFGTFGLHFPCTTSAKILAACTRMCHRRWRAICSKNRKSSRITGTAPILEMARAYGLRPRLFSKKPVKKRTKSKSFNSCSCFPKQQF